MFVKWGKYQSSDFSEKERVFEILTWWVFLGKQGKSLIISSLQESECFSHLFFIVRIDQASMDTRVTQKWPQLKIVLVFLRRDNDLKNWKAVCWTFFQFLIVIRYEEWCLNLVWFDLTRIFLEKDSLQSSGIVEVCLDRPGAKNAIGKDMLRGLQNAFEAVKEDASANVLMICSAVPRVFCAGADLKVLPS